MGIEWNRWEANGSNEYNNDRELGLSEVDIKISMGTCTK